MKKADATEHTKIYKGSEEISHCNTVLKHICDSQLEDEKKVHRSPHSTYRFIKHKAKHSTFLERAFCRVDRCRRHFHALLSHFLRSSPSESTSNAPCLQGRRAFGCLVCPIVQLHVHWPHCLRNLRCAASSERCPRGSCTSSGCPA